MHRVAEKLKAARENHLPGRFLRVGNYDHETELAYRNFVMSLEAVIGM